jgi:predicted  nucleic acid-binding Zn-ribbon protein
MEILRVSLPLLPYILPHVCFQENRLAQLATVDQQRELTRYMRGLNEWLERDVYDRQSELRDVVAHVEQLSHDIRGIRAQGKDSSINIF